MWALLFRLAPSISVNSTFDSSKNATISSLKKIDVGVKTKMSKRPNASPADHWAKRQQTGNPRNNDEFVNSPEATSQALASLAEQADELVDCLQSLKRQFSQSKNPAELQFGSINSRLSRLTKQLLPSFQIIGSLDESDAETAKSIADTTPTVRI